MRASHDHYFVPLRRRDVARVLEIQTREMGWLSGTISPLVGGFILATFSRFLTISRRQGA
jgi:hypothetical protein